MAPKQPALSTVAWGPYLRPGKWKIETVAIPNLPATILIEQPCVVLAALPVASPVGAGGLMVPHQGNGALHGNRVGLLAIIATPQEEE